MFKDKYHIKNILAYLPALLAMVFFGMSFIWTKILLKYYGPITIIFIRLVISVLLLTVFIFSRRGIKISKKDFKYFFILALFEPFLYFMGENFGVKYVSPTVASILIATIPVVTPIFTYIFLNERLSAYNIAGLILSFIGVITVLTTKNSTLTFSLKGILLLILSVLAAIGYSIIAKNLTHRYSSVDIVYIQNLIGIFYFLPFFIIFEINDIMATHLNLEIIKALLQLSVFASTFAFVLMTTSIRKLGVNRTNIFVNLIPVATALSSFIIYGKVLSIQEISGILIVIIGLFLGQKKRQREIVLHED
ncbi:MAG: DMT family transporter [Candidatus Marinimicrobia bacterium]|nr:DMT family transporter [Candidatus Neomarinimicrobiota bacterium]